MVINIFSFNIWLLRNGSILCPAVEPTPTLRSSNTYRSLFEAAPPQQQCHCLAFYSLSKSAAASQLNTRTRWLIVCFRLIPTSQIAHEHLAVCCCDFLPFSGVTCSSTAHCLLTGYFFCAWVFPRSVKCQLNEGNQQQGRSCNIRRRKDQVKF